MCAARCGHHGCAAQEHAPDEQVKWAKSCKEVDRYDSYERYNVGVDVMW